MSDAAKTGCGTGNGVVIVYTLYGDGDSAAAAAGVMVQARLAACANILSPSRSCYMWNGAYQAQVEIPVLFKTSADLRDALVAGIVRDHPYDVPAILSWDADSTPDYAAWVGTMTGTAWDRPSA